MIEGQEGVTWDQWLALARTCEELRYDALFRSDHYAGIPDGGRGALDAWTMLAAIGARTTTLRLGTLVSPATFRHPSALAKSVVTADHVTGGRGARGVGLGRARRAAGVLAHDRDHHRRGRGRAARPRPAGDGPGGRDGRSSDVAGEGRRRVDRRDHRAGPGSSR